MNFRHLFYFVLTILLTSCEKVVDINPRQTEPILAVDASIENGQPPIVILTNSLNYFDSLSSSQLLNSFARNAEVTLSNGTKTILLKEQFIQINGNNFYVYTNDFTNPLNSIIGTLNTTYNLSIKYNNKTYTATTKIPALTKKIDSLWWERRLNTDDTNRIVIIAKVTDPPGLGNYIRYFTRRNNANYLPPFNSVFDDDIVDGQTYDVETSRGIQRNAGNVNSDNYFRRGDTIDFKFCNIDLAHYNFWNTWERNQTTQGNPFSTPVKVLGNISNGAFGYFGGYAAQIKRIIIPK